MTLFKIANLSFSFAILLIANSCCYANHIGPTYSCNGAYQWTSNGSFELNNLVRYKGHAYRQKVTMTIGKQPDVNSAEWTHLGACWKTEEVKCDFNGDGQMDSARSFEEADLTGAIVSKTPPYREYADLTGVGEVTITYGNTSPNTLADQIWNQNKMGMNAYARKNAYFGEAITAGDFNSDGFCDLAIGAPGFSYEVPAKSDAGPLSKGIVNILYGSPTGLTIARLGENGKPLNPYDAQRFDQDSPGVDDAAEVGDEFGYTLAAGDFNGDGYADLAIGVPGESTTLVPQFGELRSAGYFHILYGSITGVQTTQPKAEAYFQHISGVPLWVVEAGDQYGYDIVAADFDRDGYVDLVVGAPGEDNWTGKASVFRGSPKGIDTASRVDIDDNSFKAGTAVEENKFGHTMWIDDFNSDGFPDLEVLINNGDTKNGIQYSIPGSATGLQTKNAKIIRFKL